MCDFVSLANFMLLVLNNISTTNNIHDSANGKDIKSMLINKKTISLFFQLSLTVLILLGAGLAPAQASAQSIPSTGNTYSFSNPNLSSPVRPSPTTFPPPSISPELSAA